MDRKTAGIGILCCTAVALLVAALMPRSASADFAIKDTDYQLVTVTGQLGSSTIYVIDNRLGRMAIFAYDTRNRAYVPMKVGNVSDLFTTMQK